MMNVVVSNVMWFKHRKDFARDYAGDYFFSKAVLADKPSILVYPGVIGGMQNGWMRGRPE